MSADWLRDAVLYEIYPQSFADSDGDGVGDLPGALAHLDHLAWLGVDAVWFNPCFASPFRDAGYDVSDYLTIAPRYGSNDDMVAWWRRRSGGRMRVVLDLVAGHTSAEHPWFQQVCTPTANPTTTATSGGSSRRRRLVRGHPGTPAWVRSPGPRPGYYLKNFYDAQPALNFGYARTDPDRAVAGRRLATPDHGQPAGAEGDHRVLGSTAALLVSASIWPSRWSKATTA